MHKYLILFFSALLFTGCSNNGSVPDTIINEPQMVALLTDIHLVDGALYNVPQQADSLYKYGSARYAGVFKKYQTNDAAFKRSLQYYSTRPEMIEEMYNKIDLIIQKKIDSLNKAGIKNLKNAVPR